MGLNRYFVPNLPSSGSVVLPPEESHHALRVRRETSGGSCVAFDGCGHAADCRIAHVTKREVTLDVTSYYFKPNELPGRLSLAVAMPKGDRQKAVIEKAVELGVHEILPLVCHRSVHLPGESAGEKWRRTVIEACKQCERNRLLTIGLPTTFESLLRRVASNDSSSPTANLAMFAHPKAAEPDAIQPVSLYDPIDATYPQIVLAIGPEGGFTDDEVQSALEAGWRQLDLGPRILRVETAVCAASIYAGLRLGTEASIGATA